MEIITEFDQLSPEWFKLRLGSIGGSSIGSVVAGGKGKTRTTLLYRMVGEILSGEKYEGYSNHHMERGIEQEAMARALYEFETDNTVKQVALIKATDNKHCSPDGLVGENGMIEIKCVIPSVHVETIHHDKIPAVYKKQCQWSLHISEREWIDFVSYSPLITNRPLWVKTMYRDEKLIQELNEGAEKFLEEMFKIVNKIKKG